MCNSESREISSWVIELNVTLYVASSERALMYALGIFRVVVILSVEWEKSRRFWTQRLLLRSVVRSHPCELIIVTNHQTVRKMRVLETTFQSRKLNLT